MPKKFPTPTLADVTYEYLGLHKKRARASDYDSLQNLFTKLLMRTRTSEEVRAALALDTNENLPVQMKSPAYERLLSIEGRSIKLLREYAQVMYDFGPEFQPYADKLWREAKRMEIEEEG